MAIGLCILVVVLLLLMSTTLCSVCGCSGESDHSRTVYGNVYNHTACTVQKAMVCVLVAGAVLHAMAAVSDNGVKQVLFELCMHD